MLGKVHQLLRSRCFPLLGFCDTDFSRKLEEVDGRRHSRLPTQQLHLDAHLFHALRSNPFGDDDGVKKRVQTYHSNAQEGCDSCGWKMRANNEGSQDELSKLVYRARTFLDKSDDITSATTSSSGLTSLFSSQEDLIRSCFGRLAGSHHPLLSVARIFCQGNGLDKDPQLKPIFSASTGTSLLELQLRAIIVLLVSKSLGPPRWNASTSKTNQCQGPLTLQDNNTIIKSIYTKQRKLAEITEMISAAYALHQTIVDIPGTSSNEMGNKHECPHPPSDKILHAGNHLASLLGDFLLARSSKGLASLGNSRVTELMSEAIADFAESQFLSMGFLVATTIARPRNQQQQQHSRYRGLPGPGATTKSQRSSNIHSHRVALATLFEGQDDIKEELWVRRNQLGIGALLGNACSSALLFSGHEVPVRSLGFSLGQQLGLLLQASAEIEFFTSKGIQVPIQFELCTLPVVKALELKALSRATLLQDIQAHDYEKIYKAIQQNSKAIPGAQLTLWDLSQRTKKLLNQLKTSSRSFCVEDETPLNLLFDLTHCITNQAAIMINNNKG